MGHTSTCQIPHTRGKIPRRERNRYHVYVYRTYVYGIHRHTTILSLDYDWVLYRESFPAPGGVILRLKIENPHRKKRRNHDKKCTLQLCFGDMRGPTRNLHTTEVKTWLQVMPPLHISI